MFAYLLKSEWNGDHFPVNYMCDTNVLKHSDEQTKPVLLKKRLTQLPSTGICMEISSHSFMKKSKIAPEMINIPVMLSTERDNSKFFIDSIYRCLEEMMHGQAEPAAETEFI